MKRNILTRRDLLRTSVIAGLSMPLAGFTWVEAMLAPKSEPWPRWSEHDDANASVIDHSVWTAFLTLHVAPDDKGINRLRYADVSRRDRAALENYVGDLAALPISSYARSEQLAYWINLYNARTVSLILEHYPLASIMDLNISPGLLSFGPWDKKLMTVEGIGLSLNDIEHRILRPGWTDNRVHYALNCASTGCPNLQPAAFTSANMETLLVSAARAYINHPRAVTVEQGKATVSKIYAWFQQDFGGDNRGVLAHLREHAGPDLRRSLEGITEIGAYAYDWSLNDAAQPSS
jgi:hypothetical protein